MHKITETQINPGDVKAIFKAAEADRNDQGFMRNTFSRFQKDKITAKDLQQSWKEDGFPDDIRDIERILKGHGFGKKEINKVMGSVFGGDKKGFEHPVASPTIQKIADFAKQNGIDKQLILFLQNEFKISESTYSGKALVEEIRDIFTNIVEEERTSRPELIKQYEQTQLGRSKK